MFIRIQCRASGAEADIATVGVATDVLTPSVIHATLIKICDNQNNIHDIFVCFYDGSFSVVIPRSSGHIMSQVPN